MIIDLFQLSEKRLTEEVSNDYNWVSWKVLLDAMPDSNGNMYVGGSFSTTTCNYCSPYIYITDNTSDSYGDWQLFPRLEQIE